MTSMGLSNLNPLKVRHIIYDLDNCLFDYPEGYAEGFSVETAKSAITIAQEKFAKGQGNGNIETLANMDVEDAIQIALKSYEEFGDTTIKFMRDFGLNPIELYNHHHKIIADGIVEKTFDTLVNLALQKGMEAINRLGIDQYIFSNGDKYYVRKVAEKLGVAQYCKFMIGIDSANDLDYPKQGKVLLTQKYIPSAWNDFLGVTGIPSRGGYVVGRDDRLNPSKNDRDYSHCLFIDDTAISGIKSFKKIKGNFDAPKALRMQTVFRKTDRAKIDGLALSDIDAIIDDVGAFVNKFSASILGARLEQRENPQPRPELKLMP